MQTSGPIDPFADELAALSGRLSLLVAHLSSAGLRRRVGVDDLTQDVLVQLLGSERARALRGEDLWAHAKVVARHTAIDAARRLRHAPRRSASIAPQPGASSSAALSVASAQRARGHGPLTLAAGAESGASLVRAYHSLSPEHRRVLGLRRFEGLSAAEAARRMGRSETAVHSLFRRALAAWAEAAEGPNTGADQNSGDPAAHRDR